MSMQKRWVKSNHKVIAGVLGGIAETYGWDPTILRLIYICLTLFTAAFPGFLLYIILAIVMPSQKKVNKEKMQQAKVYQQSHYDETWSDF